MAGDKAASAAASGHIRKIILFAESAVDVSGNASGERTFDAGTVAANQNGERNFGMCFVGIR